MRVFKDKHSTPRTPLLIDSGADNAMFDASIAPLLGIKNYREGTETTISGVGQLKCWIHEDVGVELRDPAGAHAAVLLKRVLLAPNFGIAGLVGREFFFEAFDVQFLQAEKKVVLDVREGSPHLVDESTVPIFKPPLPSNKVSRKQKRRR